jgi:nucleoside-diphosphate-sugar epimerase
MTDTKPVLVTGGGGFLGERICFYLRKKNDKVINFITNHDKIAYIVCK